MHFKTNYPNNRLRRLRKDEFCRDLVQEHHLLVSDLIYPMFVMDKDGIEPIKSLPGINRYGIKEIAKECKEVASLGIKAVAIFPYIDAKHKTECAKYSYDDDGLVQRAIKSIKHDNPNLGVIADVALDPYTKSGHDGIISKCGNILNDETVDILVKQSISISKAGADILAPSDMMDGRIGAIRKALEQENLQDKVLLSYSAKFASSFYGPFRDAVGSAASLGKANKKSYQLPVANISEALNEVQLDLQEGADIVMVKPGLLYLDVIAKIKQHFAVPTFAYQVSGEYAMLLAISDNEKAQQDVVFESLLSLKRAGCDAVFSYFSKKVALWLNK